jgi:hypothetical protein
MHTSSLFNFLALAELCSEAAVLLTLFRVGLSRQWPSLVASLASELVSGIALQLLIHIPGHYKAYFYTFWWSQLALILLRFSLAADIVRSLPGTRFIPWKIYAIAGTAAAIIALASAAVCFPGDPHLSSAFARTTVLLDRAATIATGSFFAVALGSVKLLGLGWREDAARIAAGTCIRIAGALVVSEVLVTGFLQARVWANILDSVVTIGVMLFWNYCLSSLQSVPRDQCAAARANLEN